MKKRKVPPPKRTPASRASSAPLLTGLGIGAAVLAIYWQTFDFGWVSFDDATYVYQNAMVRTGLSFRTLAWAFTTFQTSNWHPLTWISFLLDASLFGMNAGEQHAVNVFLHLASSVLLFLALRRMTRSQWRSALAAAIFAVHPLHVESVAWIAERKDALCVLFEILTLWFYARYAEDAKPSRYAMVMAAFALSLLSKPMAVTLPFVLVLLDIWPLRRGRRLLEKIPLFALSAGASAVTLFAQRSTGATRLTNLPFAARLGGAIVAYVRYLGKAVWPANLGMLYPVETFPLLPVIAAAAILLAITVAAILVFRRRPYILVGWLWFLGTLVPVIGLVQVGFQSIADRYMYFPLVGLSIALIWAANDVVEAAPGLRQAAGAASVAIVVAFAAVAWRQAGYWRDSITLFEHTLAVTRGNYVIHNDLGIDLQAAGRLNEAAAQFRLAVDAAPRYKDALNSLGAIVAYQGNKTEAIELHRRAVAADPNYAGARLNLGHELLETGQLDEALAQLQEGVRLEPESARGHAYLGAALLAQGHPESALEHLDYAVKLAPGNADTQSNLCSALLALGRPAQAIAACSAALKIRPNFARAQLNLGNALAADGQTGAAAAVFSKMIAANPGDANARSALSRLPRSGR